jgi:hypothetical protein
MSEIKAVDETLPPEAESKSSVWVGKLETHADIRTELARLYRTARRTAGPDVDAFTASKLAYLLQQIGRSLEGSGIEQRLAALEEDRSRK